MPPCGLEQANGPDAVGQREFDRIVERRGHLAQAGQVVDFVGPNLVEQFVDRHLGQIDLVRARTDSRVGPLARPVDAVNLVAFGPQQLRQVKPVLPCDSRNQGNPGHALRIRRR